jgi:diaminohydroxyphosphoribosylaminopyrimidine deaminase/5-amino-6-(5-phosphoribosylamino)uracil reductase
MLRGLEGAVKMKNKEIYMKRAITLAARARGMTSPNPMVGALLVKGGRVVSEAFHKRAGSSHAEALALAEAGKKAYGSTLYVSLEPCCHKNKRTPPCTEAIIAAGVKKVVIAMKDPNPQVSGKGIRQLKRAGLEVESGVLAEKAIKLNESYTKFIKTGMPFVTLKAAMTLDGKIATPKGESKWITGEKARAHVHRLRAGSDAIITAIGTIKADNPMFTARGRGRLFSAKGGDKGPMRVIIDPRLQIPLKSRVLTIPPATVIVTAASGPKEDKLIESGINIIKYKGKLKLLWLLKKLGKLGIMNVLIEGGGSLNWHALDEGVVDKALFFVAPKIIGGRKSVPVVGGESFRRLPDAIRLEDLKARSVGEDLLVEGYVSGDADAVL